MLEYVAELEGLPAIFIPPLAPDLEFEGVSVYADVPDVEDGTPARRSEKLTLVFDAGGEFSIPGRELEYWNTQSSSIEKAVSEGLVISVAGPPLPAPVGDTSSGAQWPRLVALFASLIALFVIAWRWIPAIARRYRAAAERRRQTEAHAFAQLCKVMDSGNSEAAYRAMLRWAERLGPGMNLRTFAATYGDESLRAAIGGLSAGIYGEAESAGDPKPVTRQFKAARRRYLERDAHGRASTLPPLNPT